MILVVWKYAQMHQNTFLITPDGKKYLFRGHDSGGLEVCANVSKHIFKHSWHSKKSFLRNVSGGLDMCGNALKQIFNHFRNSKIKKILVVWKYAQMHQNTFFTTPGGKKYIFVEKKFLVVWKYAQMHQNTFLSTPDTQKNLF